MRTLTRGHKAIRIASAVLVTAIIFMILAANRVVKLDNPLSALQYWALCFGLVMLLVALALLDVRQVLIGYLEERRNALRRIAESEKDE
jgi:nitric oxide reductase large subunit